MSEIQTTNYLNYKLNYNFQPNKPSFRKLALPSSTDVLPSSFDLSSKCGEAYDQLNLGSCVSNGIGKALEVNLRINSNETYIPSRLFIYYNGRIEGNDPIDQDTGLNIIDGVLSVENYSAPPETSWPYVVSQFAIKPTLDCYQLALKYKLYKFYAVQQNLSALKQTLSINLPIAFGISVYESFMCEAAAQTGIIPDPNTQTEQNVGGHCILLVGYDDSTNYFKFINSWSSSWGIDGFGYISYDYVTNPNLSSEFYVLSDYQAVKLIDYEKSGNHCFLKCL